MTLKIAISMDVLMFETWEVMATSVYPYQLDSRHEAVVQFLVDMTEYADIYFYTGLFEYAQGTIITWSLQLRTWELMHELDEMIHYVTKIPEDVDVFVSDEVVDWANDEPLEPFNSMIKELKATIAAGPGLIPTITKF